MGSGKKVSGFLVVFCCIIVMFGCNSEEYIVCGVKNETGMVEKCPEYLGAASQCICATNSCAVINSSYVELSVDMGDMGDLGDGGSSNCRFVYVNDKRWVSGDLGGNCVRTYHINNQEYGILNNEGVCSYESK
jgi:hypothetical protein